MAYIVVGIALWLFVGGAVALILGKAIKLGEDRDRSDRAWRFAHATARKNRL